VLLSCAYFRHWDEALFECWAMYAERLAPHWPPQALADMAAAYMAYPKATAEYYAQLAQGVALQVHQFSPPQLLQLLMAYGKVGAPPPPPPLRRPPPAACHRWPQPTAPFAATTRGCSACSTKRAGPLWSRAAPARPRPPTRHLSEAARWHRR
jgi:hypothetical protein